MSRGGVVTTLGTVPGVRSTDTERGLLGIAVDPNFPSSPYIYIHATDNRFGTLIAISRFTLTGDLADTGTGALAFDPASRYDLIRNLPDLASNHNGGTVRFGTGRTLYVSIGDDANKHTTAPRTEFNDERARSWTSSDPGDPVGRIACRRYAPF